MILGQVAPPNNTAALLYSATTETTVSTIFACSFGATSTIRIWVRRRGETTTTKQYLYYDEPLGNPETLALTAGITLEPGDDIMVYCTTVASVAFSAFGAVSE